jgi:short-subunit dehydrogenase
MHRSISGARALVTGASGGLGRAIGLELARLGAQVMLLARREEKLRQVVQEISQQGGKGRAEYAVCDVTKPADRTAAVAAMQSKFGGLDILVNNAGVGTLAKFENSDPQLPRTVFEINFFAPVDLTREAFTMLKAGRQPILVLIGSVVGHRGMPQNSDYCASKFALRGWSESMRVELAPLGIDVLLASPGSTVTEFWDNLAAKNFDVPWSLKGALSAEVTARAIVRGIARGKREVVPGLQARTFVNLARYFPRFTDRILKRFA